MERAVTVFIGLCLIAGGIYGLIYFIKQITILKDPSQTIIIKVAQVFLILCMLVFIVVGGGLVFNIIGLS